MQSPTLPSVGTAAPGASWRERGWRILGAVSVAIGIINAFIPVLPTTIFLIVLMISNLCGIIYVILLAVGVYQDLQDSHEWLQLIALPASYFGTVSLPNIAFVVHLRRRRTLLGEIPPAEEDESSSSDEEGLKTD